jgi:hypothetical protein
MDSLTKSQAFDRLAKSDAIGNFGRMVAQYRRQRAMEDRPTSLVKAEKAKQDADRTRRKVKKMRGAQTLQFLKEYEQKDHWSSWFQRRT